MTKTWKGWTPSQRNTSYRKTKKAIKAGLIPERPSRCARCGQDEGILDWHNTDYRDPIKYLEGLCYRCHMVLHCAHLNPQAAERYWAEVAGGKIYPALHTRNIGAVMRDQGLRYKSCE